MSNRQASRVRRDAARCTPAANPVQRINRQAESYETPLAVLPRQILSYDYGIGVALLSLTASPCSHAARAARRSFGAQAAAGVSGENAATERRGYMIGFAPLES